MRYGDELQYPVDRDISYGGQVADARVLFIQRVYAHLAGAVLAFVALEALLVNTVSFKTVLALCGGGSGWGFLFVLLAFMGASWLANTWARSETSPAMQYLGLGLYIVAEAVIFLPLLFIATHMMGSQGQYIIWQAGILTLMVFGGLTMSVFLTKNDYSSLGPILCVGSWIAFGVIIAGIAFGFTLGLFFCFAMVALLCGYILYETSQVVLHWPTHLHVAAALMLFSSVATLFWYILRILMILNSRD